MATILHNPISVAYPGASACFKPKNTIHIKGWHRYFCSNNYLGVVLSLHLINIVQSRKFYSVVIISVTIFLLSGGFYAVQTYLVGGHATTYQEYLMGTFFPFFLGSIMMGSFGLLFAYKNRQSPFCLVGFFIVIVCYFFLEYLFNAVGGNNLFGGL